MSGEESDGCEFEDYRPRTSLIGGIRQIDGFENNPEIQNLAKFAVEEHNKKENAMLQFEKVVNAKKLVVAGLRYYITLEAADGDQKKVYEAKIWEKVWENFLELLGFRLLSDAEVAELGKISSD